MAEDAPASVEELQANLLEYTGQQKQVQDLLLNDPSNEELSEMYNSLTEVIDLTRELLKDAQESAAVSQAGPSSAALVLPVAEVAPTSVLPAQSAAAALANSLLPASVAEQIRKAQVKAALSGQAPALWAVGCKCQAVYSADGQYYDATVESVTSDGKFVIVFDGYGDKEELPASSVRPQPEAEQVYQGVSAPKRKRVEEQPVVTEIPKWLEIKDDDDEKTKLRKQKLKKSYKSKMRFSNMDIKTKEKQDNWKNFLSGKGSKKKAGFFTGKKKESIFKVPDGINGKVGVVGSGAGLTDYGKRQKHLPGEEEED